MKQRRKGQDGKYQVSEVVFVEFEELGGQVDEVVVRDGPLFFFQHLRSR